MYAEFCTRPAMNSQDQVVLVYPCIVWCCKSFNMFVCSCFTYMFMHFTWKCFYLFYFDVILHLFHRYKLRILAESWQQQVHSSTVASSFWLHFLAEQGALRISISLVYTKTWDHVGGHHFEVKGHPNVKYWNLVWVYTRTWESHWRSSYWFQRSPKGQI